jgi:hypothetical protein
MSSQLETGTYPLDDSVCGQTQCNGDYATLAGYVNRGGFYTAGAPVPSQTAVQSVVIVPGFGGSGFSVLQHNLPFSQLSSSGYFNINNAYPSSANSCQQYTTALAKK